MHVQLLTLGSRGDVQPYVSLGVALKALGHEVTLTTGRGFEEMITSHGLNATSTSDDIRKLVQDPIIQEALRTFSGKIRAWREFKGEFVRQLDETWAITRETGADLLVFHPKMVGATYYAAALQIPAISSLLIPGTVATSAYPSPLLPIPNLGAFGNRLSHKIILRLARLSFFSMVDRWRSETLKDLPALPEDAFDGYNPGGNTLPRLHAYSRHIVPKPADWGPREHVTGFWWLDQSANWQPPEALARFLDAGPPPVYVGFGSMPAEDAGAMTRLVLEALKRSGHRGVLATGWGGLEMRDVPETAFMLDAAPHDWLFPRCAAVVHHGGAGTTHEGLRAGRPSIICPLGVDQPFWGRRVAALGAGPKPLPQKRLTAEGLAAAMQAIREPAMIARAEALGEAIRAEGGAKEAASILDGLAA